MRRVVPKNTNLSLPYRPLLLVAVAAGLGIVLDRYQGSDRLGGLYAWWTTGFVLTIVCVLLLFRRVNRYATCVLLMMAVCVGGAWHHVRWNYFAADDLARLAGESPEPLCIEGFVVDRVRWSPPPPLNPLRALPADSRSETVVRVARVRDGTEWRKAGGNCRLRVRGDLSGVRIGDQVLVFARFARSQPALNPGQYDWAEAERGAGRHTELFCEAPECVSVIEPAATTSFGRWLDYAARSCEVQLSRYVGTQNSDLSLAILLGARERLNDSTIQSFLKTGAVHLLVVSGLHVGLMALVVWLIFQSGFLPRRWAVLLTAILVVAYAMLAGGRPPVMRATVLILLALVALVAERRASMKLLLASAALVVLAYNPAELFRGGTQLSFLCVGALAVYGVEVDKRRQPDPLTQLIRSVEPWYRKLLRWIGHRIGHLAAASLVIWLVTAPLVAYHFHITTPASIVITPLIWPLVTIALVTGLAICTVGWVFPPIASLLGSLCSLCLSATERIVVLAEQTGIGHAYVPGPADWWLVVFYAGLALVAAVPQLQIGWKPLASLATLWVAIGLATAAVRGDDDRLHCSFLAVGHGTCVVLELPGGQTLLYDAGSLASPEGASKTIAEYLWSRGITRIDAAILSHADVDHYNAMPGLLERFDVGVVYVSPLMFDPLATEGQLDAPEFLRSTLMEAEIPLQEVWGNDRLRVADPEVEMEVLHPPRLGVAGRDNANSILLHVRYAGKSILLPGDLEHLGIEAVTAERPLDCDILLAPHHGSSNSDPPGFAAWCTPDWVVVSGRHTEHNSLTDISYREVGAKVLHTAEIGAVQFSLDDLEGIEVSSYRGEVSR